MEHASDALGGSPLAADATLVVLSFCSSWVAHAPAVRPTSRALLIRAQPLIRRARQCARRRPKQTNAITLMGSVGHSNVHVQTSSIFLRHTTLGIGIKRREVETLEWMPTTNALNSSEAPRTRVHLKIPVVCENQNMTSKLHFDMKTVETEFSIASNCFSYTTRCASHWSLATEGLVKQHPITPLPARPWHRVASASQRRGITRIYSKDDLDD